MTAPMALSELAGLARFLRARVAEDEAAGRVDASFARKARLVISAATITLFPLSEYRLRQLAERWDDHPDYDERWRP